MITGKSGRMKGSSDEKDLSSSVDAKNEDDLTKTNLTDASLGRSNDNVCEPVSNVSSHGQSQGNADASNENAQYNQRRTSIETPRSRGKSREQGTFGILRIDSASRSSRFNAAATPFLSPKAEPSSPQPSVDRLSVTFAIAEDNSDGTGFNYKRPQQPFVTEPIAASEEFEMQRIPTINDGEEGGDEDDYSASACAIMQRRTSSRCHSRRKRRSSSPFSPDAESALRRRSSAFTTSSGDTAISVEDGGTQEQIFENLKLHKEVLSGVKQQPWPLRRKMKLVQQAKSYVRRHEGALQERLAQSRSTRDVIARASILINKRWQYFRRELVNLQTWLIPWELRIKEIESHFGSAVASYFIFLRWLFCINLVISATLAAFVAIPEMLTADIVLAGERKIMLPEEKLKSKHLLTLWEFEGVLKYSPFFYGWYTNQDSQSGYRLPLAYFVANLVVHTYSFFAILRKMAENSRMSKLSEKEDECAFSWKLFTGWDFMIGNPETAHNRTASIVLGFKEALLEEAEKERDERNWKITSVRIFVNVSVISLLALSAYAVVEVVARSTEPESDSNWWRQNEITIVMSLISYIFPIFFEILGIFENHHPRKQLRIQLARIMVLNLLNLYSLIFALFDKISDMEVELQSLKPKGTSSTVSLTCKNIPVPCDNNLSKSVATLASLSLVMLANVSSTNIRNDFSDNSAKELPEFTKNNIVPYGDTELYRNAFGNSTVVDDFNVTFEYGDDYYPNKDYEYYDNFDEFDENGTEFEGSTRLYLEDNSTTIINNVTVEESSDNVYNVTSSETIDLYDTSTYSNSTNIEDGVNDSIFSSASTLSTTSSTRVTTETAANLITVADAEHTSQSAEINKNIVKCFQKICETSTPSPEDSDKRATTLVQLDIKTRRKLRRLCWETMFGQELAKLTVMDLVLTIISTLGMDFFRAVFVRFMNNCWCWDLEKQFPQYGDFKIAENILHLVNNQGMVWMGMFFSPGLAVLNLLKLGILMYLRSWAVLTCNVPHEVVFRASRSNNFYLALLLTMLFLCVLPVGYAIVWVEPSWHCGPFSGHRRIYHLATECLKNALPMTFRKCLDYIASPGIVIPLIVLMALIIYYMVSLTGSLREANNDLKIQLRRERTEERRKMFRIAEKRQEVHDTPFTRWKKILPTLPSKSADIVAPKGVIGNVVLECKERKRSATSEAGEATDMEQDSLPHDPALSQQDQDDNKTKNVALTKQTSNNRSISSGSLREGGDSLESQSSDYGVIPKIRINGTEGVTEVGCHSNINVASGTTDASASSSNISTVQSKQQLESNVEHSQ